MSAEINANTPGKSTLRRWFGLGHPSSEGEDDTPGNAMRGSLQEEAQRDLLEQISLFLLEYRLAVSPANLLAAHAAFSGANTRLARKIAVKRNDGEPITQAWLDETAQADDSDTDKKAEVDRLMAKLQSGVEVFTSTTQQARNATGEYHEALTKQVGEIARADTADKVLSSLADIAKSMLERTRQVEEEMQRSEREANSLRKSLAKAQRDAEVDHLTGLPNRRAFEATLDRHYREAKAAIEPLCIAFCDIDHFKRVNDTHGHETGDRVIQAVGQVLSRISNENCHVARHGGEEFVVLLRNVSRQDALEKLNAVREQMAQRRFVNRATDEPIGAITFSGGIADVFAYGNPRDALEAADKALYRAKQEGRNQILLAEG